MALVGKALFDKVLGDGPGSIAAATFCRRPLRTSLGNFVHADFRDEYQYARASSERGRNSSVLPVAQ